MNEHPNPLAVDWEGPDDAPRIAFWTALKTLNREELLSYPDMYVIPVIQHWGKDGSARLRELFPESVAWAEGVNALTVEEMDSGGMEPFVEQMKKMRGLPRILAWSAATRYGIDQFERTSRLHKHCAFLVLQVFECDEKNVVPNFPRSKR